MVWGGVDKETIAGSVHACKRLHCPQIRCTMKPLSIRLTPRQIAWLDDRRAEGEPRSMVVRRLLGELMAGEVERTTGSVGAQANQ